MSKTSIGISAFLIAVMVGIALIIANPTVQRVTCEKCNGTGHIVTEEVCPQCVKGCPHCGELIGITGSMFNKCPHCDYGHSKKDSAIKCDFCHGTGFYDDSEPVYSITEKCHDCKGTGKCRICEGSGIRFDKKCFACNGTGKCDECKGSGKCQQCLECWKCHGTRFVTVTNRCDDCIDGMQYK